MEQTTDFESLLKYSMKLYEERIPFNKFLKIKILSLKENDASVRFDMREDLIGNFTYNMLHGGVISSVLDLTGGLVVSYGVLKKIAGNPMEEIAKKMSKIGTIDLRVDFLRPGRGEYFLATGSIMRMGNTVVVTRMSLHNDENILIAVGTGTYIH